MKAKPSLKSQKSPNSSSFPLLTFTNTINNRNKLNNLFIEEEELQDITPSMLKNKPPSISNEYNASSKYDNTSTCSSSISSVITNSTSATPTSLSFAKRFLNQFSLPNLLSTPTKTNEKSIRTPSPNFPQRYAHFDSPDIVDSMEVRPSSVRGSKDNRNTNQFMVSPQQNTPTIAEDDKNFSTITHEETLKRKINNSSPLSSSIIDSIGIGQLNSDRSLLPLENQRAKSNSRTHEIPISKKQSLQSSLSNLKEALLKVDDCCERDCNHKTSSNHQEEETKQYQPLDSSYCWCDRSNLLNCSCGSTGSHHHHNINNSTSIDNNIINISNTLGTTNTTAFIFSPSREALFHQFKHYNIKSLLNTPSSLASKSVDNLINLMTESEAHSSSTTTNNNSTSGSTATQQQQQQDNQSSSVLLENLCSRYRRIIEDVCILSLNTTQINEIIQTKFGECLKATLESPPSTPSSPAEEEEKNAVEETANNKPSNVIIHVKREATLIDNYPKEKKKKSSNQSSEQHQQHFQEDSFLGGSDLTPLSLQFFTFPNDIIAQLIACKKSNDSPLLEDQDNNNENSQENTSSPLEFELKCIDARKHTLLKDIFSGEEQLESLENNNSNDQEEDQEEDYENFIEQSKIHPPARSYHTFINTDHMDLNIMDFVILNFSHTEYAFHSTFLKFYSFLDQYLFENNDGFFCSDCGYFTFNEELLKYMYDFFNNTDPNATPATPSGLDMNLSLPALYDKLVVHFPSMAITSPSDYVFTSKTSTDPSSNCINEVKVEFDKMLFVGTKEEHFKEASPIDKHHHQPSSPNSNSPSDPFDDASKSTEKAPNFPMCDFDYSILTTCLSIDNIITIVNYLSLEKSLIFHSVNLYRMVMVMESLRHLIYPFRMTSIYIPIAHEKIINFLEAPFPYMVGTHSEVMWNHFRIGFEKKSSPFRRTLCSQFEAPSSSHKVNVLNLNETKFSNKDNMDYEMINIPEGVCIVNLDEDVIRFVGEESDVLSSKTQWKWSSALMQYIKDAVEKSRSNFEKSNSEYMNQIIKKRDAQIPSLTRRGSSFFFKGRKKGSSTFIKNSPSVKNILESSEEVEVTGKDPLSSGLFSPSANSNDHYLNPSQTRKRSAAVRPLANLTQKEPPPTSTLTTPRLSISNSQAIISKRKKSVMAVAQENQVSPLLTVHPIREIFLNVFIRLLTCYEIFIQFDKFDPKNDMNMTDIFNIDKFLSLDNYGGFTPGSSQVSQNFNPFQLKDKTINKKLLMALTHYGNYGGHVDSVFLREFFKTQIFHYFIQKKCELFWNISNSFKSNTPEGNMPMKRTDFAQSLPDLFVQHDNMLEQNKQLSEHVLASTVTNTFYKLFDYKMQQSTERFSLNLSLMQTSYRRSFLYKRGRFRKSWKKRFFVLRDDNTMLYYEGAEETQLKGSIKLTTDGLTKVFSVKVNEKRIFEKNSESEDDSYFTWTKNQQLELASLLKFARAMNQSEDAGSATNNNEEEGVPSTSEQFPTPYVFVVFVPGGRLLYCCAESEKAREEWIKVLRAKVMQSNVTSSLQDYLNRLKWQQSKKNFNKKIIINSVGHIINHQPSTSSISHIQSSPNLVNSPTSPVTAIHQQPLVLHKIFDFVPIAFRNSSERYKERNADLDIQSISTRMPLEEFTLRSCLEVIN